MSDLKKMSSIVRKGFNDINNYLEGKGANAARKLSIYNPDKICTYSSQGGIWTWTVEGKFQLPSVHGSFENIFSDFGLLAIPNSNFQFMNGSCIFAVMNDTCWRDDTFYRFGKCQAKVITIENEFSLMIGKTHTLLVFDDLQSAKVEIERVLVYKFYGFDCISVGDGFNHTASN